MGKAKDVVVKGTKKVVKEKTNGFIETFYTLFQVSLVSVMILIIVLLFNAPEGMKALDYLILLINNFGK